VTGFPTLSFAAAPLPALPPSVDYLRILPEIVLSIFGMVIMVLDPLMDEKQSRKILGAIALVGAVAGIWATWCMARSPGVALWNMVRVDGFTDSFCSAWWAWHSCHLPLNWC
jgi:NADH:ubiquinone oxidoreductase subunit 2 (subunit N)